jgi:5-methyltetrahydropteroyltriglutamate--homocysteine methyltransferase
VPGEISSKKYAKKIEKAERRAIRDQLHPGGSEVGLYAVSNGEQRKSSYTAFLPNRFHGFSAHEKVHLSLSKEARQEMVESNPALLNSFTGGYPAHLLPKIETKLVYRGALLARGEAEDAARLASEEKAPRIFIPSPSPGVIPIFFYRGKVYRDHLEYVAEMSKEMREEYKTILSVDGVDLQIDAPDLAMAKMVALDWGIPFFEALPHHIDAINEAIAGLPRERIRVHYCYGNRVGSHRNDADFARMLPELMRLKVGTIVGEMANPTHEGDIMKLRDYLREQAWPKGLTLAAGVIDVKTPILESQQTVAERLDRIASIDKIGPERIMAGTDCGFETFVGVNHTTYLVGLQKLEAAALGAQLESERLRTD